VQGEHQEQNVAQSGIFVRAIYPHTRHLMGEHCFATLPDTVTVDHPLSKQRLN